MAPDELQAAIERRKPSRRQLLAGFQRDGAEVNRILVTVPRVADLCGARIALGLKADLQACEEARIVLRSLIPDGVRLSKKPDGSCGNTAQCSRRPYWQPPWIQWSG